MKRIEVLFSPAEFLALKERDLSRTTCVVFDILRATSTIVTALAHGAKNVRPVETIEAALAAKKKNPAVLLAGEREGFRITRELTGSVDFDLGNSPREFPEKVVRGKEIVLTTTNGSRAIYNCRHAKEVLIGSFLNLNSVAKAAADSEELLIVCSGTHEAASFEDALGAGALCDLLWPQWEAAQIADSAHLARLVYQQMKGNLLEAMKLARNGRRLLSIPELRDDVSFCLQLNIFDVVPSLNVDGIIALE